MTCANALVNRIGEGAPQASAATMDREFEELYQRAGRNLIAFLDAELDLGFTFVRTAEIEAATQNHDHLKLARKSAEGALETVLQFQARVVSLEIRREIQARAADLGIAISKL
jgi:hypothetical protein